jgi:hypothetical protein
MSRACCRSVFACTSQHQCAVYETRLLAPVTSTYRPVASSATCHGCFVDHEWWGLSCAQCKTWAHCLQEVMNQLCCLLLTVGVQRSTRVTIPAGCETPYTGQNLPRCQGYANMQRPVVVCAHPRGLRGVGLLVGGPCVWVSGVCGALPRAAPYRLHVQGQPRVYGQGDPPHGTFPPCGVGGALMYISMVCMLCIYPHVTNLTSQVLMLLVPLSLVVTAWWRCR